MKVHLPASELAESHEHSGGHSGRGGYECVVRQQPITWRLKLVRWEKMYDSTANDVSRRRAM